jgi:NAD(P)-dependent dehydrogenase (short-subunit alcohol dehydrogenase family)
MNDIPRTALVTGAARRIGSWIARALADEGFAVALHCRTSREAAEDLRREIVARGGRAVVLAADLADVSAVDALVPAANDALGPLGVLVNNASEFEPDETPGLERARYERHMAVDLAAPVFLADAFARRLPPTTRGLIVNILDQRVLKPTPRFFSYALAKAALASATVTMAQALAPRIRVVGLAPGPTLANARQAPEDFARQAAATLLRHGPEAADFAAAVRFLLAAPSVTGQIVALDGGQHLAWETPDVVGVGE